MTGAPGPSLLPHLRKLLSHAALYGAADVFTNVVNFLLVPLYTAFLTPSDYGDLALLLLFSTLAKILFRMGLDSAFFRVHYDLKGESEQRVLAGTAFLFSALVGAVLFGMVALFSPLLGRLLLGQPGASRLVVLAAADVFLGLFAFVPLTLLRIQDRAGLFATLAAVRHLANTLLKIALVVKGWGVLGVLVSDVAATALLSALVAPRLLRHAAFAPSRQLLRELLRFGLPKVPHGLLLQVQNLADRKILDLFVSRAEVGLYQVGYTFGMGVKFPISAFEPAWQPFVYSQLKSQDAPRTLARVATFAWAGFLFCGVALAAVSGELIVLMTPKSPAFRAAAPVIPVVVLAYLLQGGFLLTTIGIGIAKKARYYPLVTLVAAATNVAANLLLVPRFGILGAAWATVASYAVMAGLGFFLAQPLYPVPWEAMRLARATALGALVYASALLAPTALVSALAVKAALLAAFALGLAFLLRGDGVQGSFGRG
ncbi:MAG TPA: oligosaccharide flippase family protein [Vicinamibacteria bacterium]|nr:oligosaccharide flippase family protein [Vicinamibacteria bacterium]